MNFRSHTWNTRQSTDRITCPVSPSVSGTVFSRRSVTLWTVFTSSKLTNLIHDEKKTKSVQNQLGRHGVLHYGLYSLVLSWLIPYMTKWEKKLNTSEEVVKYDEELYNGWSDRLYMRSHLSRDVWLTPSWHNRQRQGQQGPCHLVVNDLENGHECKVDTMMIITLGIKSIHWCT